MSGKARGTGQQQAKLCQLAGFREARAKREDSPMVDVALEDQNAKLQRGTCAALLCTYNFWGSAAAQGCCLGSEVLQEKGITALELADYFGIGDPSW